MPIKSSIEPCDVRGLLNCTDHYVAHEIMLYKNIKILTGFRLIQVSRLESQLNVHGDKPEMTSSVFTSVEENHDFERRFIGKPRGIQWDR